MATYMRLMVIKQRSGWGYETLVREVSGSLHLRRFCLIGISERVPCESTVRKLTRRLGAGTVAELTRAGIAKAVRERRFRARAARIDSTVVEADVRYASDAMLCLRCARELARQGRRLAARIGVKANAVRNRSPALGRRVRAISRTLARRTGQAREQVIELNADAGRLFRRSADRAAGRTMRADHRADCPAACRREDLRPRRLDRRPDARPIRKGKAGALPNVTLIPNP